MDGEEEDDKGEETVEETRSLLTPTPILESSSPMVLSRKKATPQPPKAAALAATTAEETEEEAGAAGAVVIDKNDLNLTPLKKYNSSATVNKVDKLISLDLNKHVAENGKTQEEFLVDLRRSPSAQQAEKTRHRADQDIQRV